MLTWPNVVAGYIHSFLTIFCDFFVIYKSFDSFPCKVKTVTAGTERRWFLSFLLEVFRYVVLVIFCGGMLHDFDV